jgi:polyphosphate kinase
MKEKSNFYNNLKEEIERHIKRKDYLKALQLIDEEFSMPYIPKDVESFLIEKHDLLTKQIINNEKKIDLQKILELLSADIKAIDKFDLASNLRKYNLTEYKEEIQDLLLAKESILNYPAKKNILNILLEQKDNNV